MSGWTSHEEESWDYMETGQEPPTVPETPNQAPPPAPSVLAMALFEAFQRVVESAHDHDWKILSYHHEQIGFEHPRQPPSKMTILLIRCFDCGDIQTTSLSGFWKLEEILRTRELEIDSE